MTNKASIPNILLLMRTNIESEEHHMFAQVDSGMTTKDNQQKIHIDEKKAVHQPKTSQPA